jgi:hypothetical protein
MKGRIYISFSGLERFERDYLIYLIHKRELSNHWLAQAG